MTDPTIAALAELAARPWGAWQEFVDWNRVARAELEKSVAICGTGDLGLFKEPLSAPARREIARLDIELRMLAVGLDPYTGRPLAPEHQVSR